MYLSLIHIYCLCDSENTQVCRTRKLFIKIIKVQFVITYETMHTHDEYLRIKYPDLLYVGRRLPG